MAKDDLQAQNNLKRIDDLEAFKKGFEGKELDAKIEKSIQDSTLLQKTIKNLVWETIKDKIIWVIGTVVILLAYNFFVELAKELAQKATGH